MSPAKSKKQRIAACVAYAVKKGTAPASKLKGTSKKMYESMTKEQLRDYCKK